MSELKMNCETCGRWAAGWCLAQQSGTSRDDVCNAWELSRVVEWEDENEKMKSRITALEAENERLQNAWYVDETICPDGSLRPEVSTLLARIAELEYNEANDAASMHALLNILDINGETGGVSDDMYKTAHNLAYKLRSRVAELEAENERLKACESALISMVNQFFYSSDDDNILRHAFMSAEEEAANYLVEHGIAQWADERKGAIYFKEFRE